MHRLPCIEVRNSFSIAMLLTDGFGGFGGISVFNRNFLRALDQSAYVERIYALPRVFVGDAGERIPEAVIYQRKAAVGKIAFLKSLIILALSRRRVDVVICGHLNLFCAAILLAKIKRARLALIIHGLESWTRPSYIPANWLLRAADSIISVSNFSAQRFSSWSKIPVQRIFILHNCVDLDVFLPGPPDLDLARRYRVASEDKVILTVGRLDTTERLKGIDQVIDIIPRLIERYPSLKYLIVGDGSDRPRLERKAETLGLSDRVIFAGQIPDGEKVAHYNLADAYVMPSVGEGFGIVLVEAAACGLSIVGSRADGSREALQDGLLGRLVDPKNQDEIMEALIGVLADKRAHKRLNNINLFSFENFKSRVHRWCEDQVA
ncbi:MAG: glycosyltransferase family 4 protein [Rhizobiales bacterium]|nr:glycosyltransferase family 4 protein [Hyphomicrobiales bacterium]